MAVFIIFPSPITLAVVKQMVKQVKTHSFPMNGDGGSQLRKKKERKIKRREKKRENVEGET